MKRYLAILLVITLLIGSSFSSFAKPNGKGNGYGKQHKNEEKAKILYDLGLFNGTSNTDFVPELDRLSTRAEAIVLIGRALDWSLEDITTVDGFDDVPSWAAPYVQYALDNNITKGTGHRKFGADLPVNARMIYTWYYRALLYSGDSWDNPNLLVEAGLLTQEQIDELSDALSGTTDVSIIRDEIIAIMFNSMQWKEKGSNQRLIQKLIKRGRVNKNKAQDCGLWPPTTTDEVTFDVKADSLKAVKVEFDQDLDTSTVSGDLFNVEINNIAQIFNTDFTIETEASTIYIIFKDLLNEGSTVSVGFEEGILSTEGIAVTLETDSAVVDDSEAPEVSDIDLVNSTTINIVFSEPMDLNSNILITHILIDGNIIDGTFTMNNSKTGLAIVLDNPLTDGSHIIRVISGLTDYSGLKTTDYQKVIGLSDTTAPYIVSATADERDSIVVEFSEPIQEDEGYIIVGQDQYFIDDATVDDNKVTLSLDVPLESESATVGVLLTVSGIKDLDNNLVNSTTGLYFILKATNDTTPPIATVRLLANKTIEVQFSEAIGGFTSDDYTLLDVNSDEVPTVANYYSVDNKAYIILSTLPSDDVTYTLTIFNTVLDNSVNQNPFETKSYQIKIII